MSSATTALEMASSTMSTLTAPAQQAFTFGIVDYCVFFFMLITSASVGVYFGFIKKAKNTTEEYLMGGHKMKVLPVAVSLVASQLSGVSIMAVPAETYSFGAHYFIYASSMMAIIPILTCIIIPVFYENKFSNCYEYLQLRFNRTTRKLVTAVFVLNALLTLPVFIFVPALAFSQVSGINIHIINAAVCSICVFYTMLGGIKAVVWSDVLQAGIMLSSVILVAVLGTLKVGGLGKVLATAAEGGRLDFSYDWDPRTRFTVWNAFLASAIMWTGHIGLNQSCVQRIVSLPSLKHAQKSLKYAGIGVTLIMTLSCFTGIIMFARYYGCDPVQAGLVEKADKLMPFFVQDIVGHLSGMPGVFISCVFSAALSTMSATLNSLAGVVYFDYVKPYIKHTDARANAIMKTFVVAMGIYCILAGFAVHQFNSILQLIVTVTGVHSGASVGLFLMGMFVPRVNGKVAVVSLAISVIAMIVLIITANMRMAAGILRYDPMPTSIAECEAKNWPIVVKSLTSTSNPFDDALAVTTEVPRVTTAFSSNRDFSIFEISFFWYRVIGVVLIWAIAIPLSYIWKRKDDDKINPKLFTPMVRKYLSPSAFELEEVPLKNPEIIKTTILMPEEKEKPNGTTFKQ